VGFDLDENEAARAGHLNRYVCCMFKQRNKAIEGTTTDRVTKWEKRKDKLLVFITMVKRKGNKL
jgi:hypothetical protein